MHVLFSRNKWLKVSEGTYAAGAGMFDLTTANAFFGGANVGTYQDGNHILWANDGTNTLMTWISATAPGGLTLDVELCLDPGYADSGAWDTVANWTVGGGVLTGAVASNVHTSKTAIVTPVGGLFRTSYDIKSRTAGTVAARIAGVVSGAFRSTVADNNLDYLTHTGAAAAQAGIVANISSFSGTIDNFSIKRVTDCAATGALLLSTKGGARGFISLPSAFNGNLAGTYRILRSY